MTKTEEIVQYLILKYDPSVIITYGSFGNGTNDEHSDFDALVIGEVEYGHDDSVVSGTELDVFLYPEDHFNDFDITEIEQIYDGTVALDQNGLGKKLLSEAKEYISCYKPKTLAEKKEELSWCRKMLLRTERKDPEGYYRWHWLLIDSLEIYCDLQDQRYLGPKKSLAYLEKTDKKGYELYTKALAGLDHSALRDWINYLGTKEEKQT